MVGDAGGSDGQVFRVAPFNLQGTQLVLRRPVESKGPSSRRRTGGVRVHPRGEGAVQHHRAVQEPRSLAKRVITIGVARRPPSGDERTNVSGPRAERFTAASTSATAVARGYRHHYICECRLRSYTDSRALHLTRASLRMARTAPAPTRIAAETVAAEVVYLPNDLAQRDLRPPRDVPRSRPRHELNFAHAPTSMSLHTASFFDCGGER